MYEFIRVISVLSNRVLSECCQSASGLHASYTDVCIYLHRPVETRPRECVRLVQSELERPYHTRRRVLTRVTDVITTDTARNLADSV